MEPTTILPTTTISSTTSIDRRNRFRGRWAIGLVAAALAVGGTVACGGADDAGEGGANDVATAPAPAPNGGPAVPVSSGGDSTSGGSTGGSNGSNGGSNGGGSSSPTTAPTTPPSNPDPSGPPPVIDSFDTPENIDCHNGNFQEFTASWTTTDAERVTISIDGPGAYAEYSADGEASLPFNCSSPHSFLLTAYGAEGQTVTRQVILEPRNAQPEPDPEGPDDLTAAEDEAP